MGDIAALLSRPRERSNWSEGLTLDGYARAIAGLGYGYPFTTTLNRNEEPIEGDFVGLTAGAFRNNSVVFACLMKRAHIFSQPRLQFQQRRGGQLGDLFGTADLSIIEDPESGMGTPDLLTAGIIDADLAGDWFGVRRPGRVKRLRPDWTVIIVGSPNEGVDYPAWDPDAEIVGFSFMRGGPLSSTDPVSYGADEVAHFAPIPDPMLRYRGMALPIAALRDIRGDTAATTHKLAFMENAATPNLAVKFPPGFDAKKAEQVIDIFEQEHSGAANAYRTMYLLGGAEIEVVGKDMKELDFAATQGKGETRIVAAMGLHPALVPVSEGMQGAVIGQSNFGVARRSVADTTFHYLWTNMAKTLETIVPPPRGARLWWDLHIPFLAEDIKDQAEVIAKQGSTIRTLTDGGYEAPTVVDAVVANDLRRLKHTGYLPVQVQPVQAEPSQNDTNGSGQAAPAAALALLEMPGMRTERVSLPMARAPHGYVASRTFWPTSGEFAGETIEAGEFFEAGHPLVRAFPSMFDTLTAPLTTSPVAQLAAAHPHGKE